MKKRIFLILIVLFALFGSAIAQIKVTGIINDPDGASIPGASVIVKGTTLGTTSDMDGKYTLTVNSSKAVLQFSFVGMKPVDEVVNGRTTINVKMESDNVGLNEVVVTALGIQRDKKTLTYASQQVSGDEMLKAKDPNFMNALSGKTAGLDIKQTSSGVGGSTRVVLRGSKSLNGLSSPLYVIDGVPMANNTGGQAGMWGGTDQGDGLSQMNPDDIESINILKGSNAAVLYGSQGANGVVMITTKKGKAGKTDVTFSSSTLFESVIATPELQFDYGSVNGALGSWATTKGNYQRNYVKDFFQTGSNLTNSVTVSGGNDKTTAYFSYSNNSAKGIQPTNKYQKNNLTFRSSTKLGDKLTVSTNVMLTEEQTNNRPGAGYYLNPLTGLYLFPRDRDFASYKENYAVFNKDRNMDLQNWFVTDDKQSNPYWIINKQPKTDITKRAIASITLDYDISKSIKFKARGNYDYAVKSNEERDAAGSNNTNVGKNGAWNYKKYDDQLKYADGLFTFDKKFSNFSVNGILGVSYQETIYGKGEQVNTGTNAMLYPNEYSFQNIPSNVRVQSIYGGRVIKEGVFANAQIGYKDMLYLDLSGRNDWSSTLTSTGNDSYFYPSFGLTGIISQMVTLPDFISFAKVRGSHSIVGNDVPFNVVNPQNSINGTGSGIDMNTQRPFTNLKPEMLTSDELGTEWKFLKGRIGFDLTYYNIKSENQFLTIPAPSGQQWTYYYVNAGEIVNKGFEITVDAQPVKAANAGDFDWKTNINFSTNKNKVVSLIPEFADRKVDLGSSEGYYNYIKAGGSFGDLYGYKFARNAAGQIILDPTSGKPTKSADVEFLGNLEPDFTLGWNNNFNYKNFSLSFLINAKIGGHVYSQTEAMLDGYGVSKRSGDARTAGGVVINAIQGTTAVTKIDPFLYYTAIGDRNGIAEPYIYDRTNIRLGQLAFTYDLNVAKLKLPVKSASFSLVGRNLFFFYKKAPYDPELTMSSSLQSQAVDNFSLPSTRTYGFNLKISF